jgi:transcriptional regulator with XRE-family HTH domain
LPFCYKTLTAKKPSEKPYPKELKNIGDHIRKRRLDLDLHQKDVATILGVDTMTVNNWEMGRRGPTLRAMPQIIEFLSYNPLNHSGEMMTLGERITRHRKALGISQKKLAKLLGVDWSTLAHWERGTSKPSRKLAERLASFLRVVPAMICLTKSFSVTNLLAASHAIVASAFAL